MEIPGGLPERITGKVLGVIPEKSLEIFWGLFGRIHGRDSERILEVNPKFLAKLLDNH